MSKVWAVFRPWDECDSLFSVWDTKEGAEAEARKSNVIFEDLYVKEIPLNRGYDYRYEEEDDESV